MKSNFISVYCEEEKIKHKRNRQKKIKYIIIGFNIMFLIMYIINDVYLTKLESMKETCINTKILESKNIDKTKPQKTLKALNFIINDIYDKSDIEDIKIDKDKNVYITIDANDIYKFIDIIKSIEKNNKAKINKINGCNSDKNNFKMEIGVKYE